MKKFSNWMLILSAFMLILALSGCVVAVEKFTITYENELGTAPASTKIIEGVTLKKDELPTLVHDGYDFLGWYVKGDTTLTVVEEGKYPVKKNITLVAKWEKAAGSKEDPQKTTWTVTYNNGGHGAEKTADEVTKGETLPATSIAALEATGWRFDGWYVGETRVDATYKPTANVTLTAKWTQLFTVNIYKDADNTVPAWVLTIPNGDAISLNKDTDYKDAKTDYLFDGYWTKKTAEAEAVQYIDKDGKVVEGKTVTANLDLYPVFYAELKSITVTGSKLFKVNDTFDNTAYTVTAKYGEGIADKTLAAADWSQTGFNTASTTSNGTFTVSYVDHGITKEAEASYYVRAADSLTETVSEKKEDTFGVEYYCFGDFPFSEVTANDAFVASLSSNPVYKDWYLDNNGYFYEKLLDEGGDAHYYTVKPIKWRKLTDNYLGSNKALLVSYNIVTGGVYYYSSLSNRLENTIHPNNYKYSTIRAFLNGKYVVGDTQDKTENDYTDNGLLQIAFTESAQSLINETTLSDVDTVDKLFLLSKDDAKNSAFGYISNNTRYMYTYDDEGHNDFAMAKGVEEKADDITTWLLRTQAAADDDEDGWFTNYVIENGSITTVKVNATTKVAIVPALTIDPSLLSD